MFNPANLANEIFGILRSFDYVVNIFDFDGNRVYEPDQARRFFASPKNITVSVHEDGENSSIKMFLSKSIKVAEVTGLISTMRATASKYGVLFNVRKYERELKPKDLAPSGSSDFESGISLSKGSEEHTPEGDKLDRIASEVGELTTHFKEIVALRKTKVKESMTVEKDLNEADGQTADLGILGVSVEADAWENFKKGYLAFSTLPDLAVNDDEVETYSASYSATHGGVSLDRGSALKSLQVSRVIDAIKKPTPLLAAAFQTALDMYATGSAPRVIEALVGKIIAARSHGEDPNGNFHEVGDHDGTTPPARDLISIKEYHGKIERQAWQDFVNDHIDLHRDVDFNSVRLGPTANKLAVYLHLIADQTKTPGLANLFNSFASDIEDGKSTPFRQKVAKHAIEIAQQGKVDTTESLIMTESIRAFAQWFDSFSTTNLFENHYDAPEEDDNALHAAWAKVKSEFDAGAFLDSHGSDFNWGMDGLTDEEKTFDYNYIKASLTHYLMGELDHAISDGEYPDNGDASQLADDFMSEVMGEMAKSGWIVEVAAEPVREGEGEDTDLATEDILLPSRADDDFAREVTADHDTDEMDRIVALARGPAAAWSPMTPRP